MKTVSNSNFGLLIAYLAPGFTTLWAMSYCSETVKAWLGTTTSGLPTVGGFLYVTVYSIAAGVTVSAVRWALLDTLHHRTGIERPRTDFSRLGKRCAGFAFIAYIVHGLLNLQPQSADDWIGIIIRACACAGIILGASWVCLAAIYLIYRHSLALPVTKIRQQKAARKTRKDADEHRRHVDAERQRQAWEDADRRECERQQAAEQSKSHERCHRARVDCELLWIALSPVIGPQFSKQELSTFFTNHMADDCQPEVVEQHARKLKRTLRTLYDKAQPDHKFQSLEDAVAHFERAKREVADFQFEDPNMRVYLETELQTIMLSQLEQIIKAMGVSP